MASTALQIAGLAGLHLQVSNLQRCCHNTFCCYLLCAQVGPGVKDLDQGDVVLPARPLLGCWAEAAVVKGRELVRVGSSMATSSPPGAARGADAQLLPEGAALARDELPLPLEYLAAHRELLLACTLLEGDTLKVGESPQSPIPGAAHVIGACACCACRACATHSTLFGS